MEPRSEDGRAKSGFLLINGIRMYAAHTCDGEPSLQTLLMQLKLADPVHNSQLTTARIASYYQVCSVMFS